MTKITALAFSLLFSIHLANAQSKITRIEGGISVEVDEKRVMVKLQYAYIPDTSTSEIKLFLSPDVIIDSLYGDAVQDYSFNKDADPLPTVTISLNQTLPKGDQTSFTIGYHGYPPHGFWTDDYNYIDLDPDFFLLPTFADFSYFNYSIEATIDNHNYQFVDRQNSKMVSQARIVSTSPSYYFQSIVAGRNFSFKSISKGKYTINIIADKPDSAIATVTKAAVNILDFFNQTIAQGDSIHEFTILYRPLPDSLHVPIRNLTQEAFIIFNSNHNRISTLSHEIAHFWWSRASNSTMENWLNESFAEYSQMMYVRDTQGRNHFDEIIAALRDEVKALPSLLGSDRFGKYRSDLLYKKGPYLLYQLEKAIGERKFVDLLQQINKREIATTNAMLDVLEEVASQAVRDNFERKLIE